MPSTMKKSSFWRTAEGKKLTLVAKDICNYFRIAIQLVFFVARELEFEE